MRYKPQIDPSHIYVAGRAGGLVDFANPLTFSLIQKIYAPHGPFRSELYTFGLGNPAYQDNFIINVFGRIYTDITIESKVVWSPSGFKLELDNNQVVTKLNLFGSLFPTNIFGLARKLASDIVLQINPKRLQRELDLRYLQFSKTMRAAVLNHHLTLNQFLNLYRDITHISYIYETLTSIYDPKNTVQTIKAVQEYIRTYDFFINDIDERYEHAFIPLGFQLGHQKVITPTQDEFIPESLPGIDTLNPKLELVAKLQTMKNNMRLKMYPLLYELNTQLQEVAKLHNIDLFSFLTIDELLSVDDSADYYDLIISERQEYYAVGERMNLPTVIKGGSIEPLIPQDLTATTYQGIGCSAGKVTGVLDEINDPNRAVVSSINVFPTPSPEFTAHFKQSKGIIFQAGSPLAHGAIVAREFKIPAIILDTELTPLLGKKVTIDGTAGTLSVVE